MKKEDVPKALEMAIAFKENANDNETKEAALKLIEILSFAKEHNSLVYFWFQRGTGNEKRLLYASKIFTGL